ncbi:hypothetical protein TNCV_3634321 [Trichonephila clavipes]|nr:hypothetical protein TNCV_3634321 [Trichonephila clavipes]
MPRKKHTPYLCLHTYYRFSTACNTGIARSHPIRKSIRNVLKRVADFKQKNIHSREGWDLTFPKTFPFSIKNYLHSLNGGEDVARFTATTRYLFSMSRLLGKLRANRKHVGRNWVLWMVYQKTESFTVQVQFSQFSTNDHTHIATCSGKTCL